MPSPWDVANAFVQGLDPRQVWSNTTDTLDKLLGELDRPRAAVKASQVESQDAADFLSMLGLAAQGAWKGLNNPEQYPSAGFVESMFTDPLAVMPFDELRYINALSGNRKSRWLDDAINAWRWKPRPDPNAPQGWQYALLEYLLGGQRGQ